MNDKDFIFKVIMFGDAKAGKTTLCNRMISGKFNPNLMATIGTEFFIYHTQYNDTKVSLSIWDLAGDDQFHFLLQLYCNGARLAILVMDLTRPNTIDNFQFWTTTIRKFIPQIPILLVGTKSDLGIHSFYTSQKITQLKQQWNLFEYCSISSKDGNGINNYNDIILKKLCSN